MSAVDFTIEELKVPSTRSIGAILNPDQHPHDPGGGLRHSRPPDTPPKLSQKSVLSAYLPKKVVPQLMTSMDPDQPPKRESGDIRVRVQLLGPGRGRWMAGHPGRIISRPDPNPRVGCAPGTDSSCMDSS